MFNYFLIFVFSFLCSLIFILVFKHLFYKLKILDNPKKYKMKRAPIPYAMGVVFFMVFMIISYFFIDYNYKLGLIWVFGFFITSLSFWDDLLYFSPKIRLIFQIIIWAIIWVTSIKIGYISNIFWGIINLETYNFTIFGHTIFIIPLLFTIIWYVFIFNALNWSDGIQWNTAWISIISFLILFFLWIILFFRDEYEWWIENAVFIMKNSLILIWILLPFWWFDFHEKILMWDSGTMFLGFMLATLAIISGWKIATVLVVFWIYSVDAIYVIIKRILNRKNPLKWDFTHLHHRLLNTWLTKNQVLVSIYSLSFLFWLTALFLDKTGKIIVFGIIVVVVIFINKIMETLIPKTKKKKAFTFAELIVSITIIALISVASVSGFFSFLENREVNSKLNNFTEKIKELDKKVQNMEIFKYEISFNPDSFVVYENKLKDEISGVFSINPWIWELELSQTGQIFVEEEWKIFTGANLKISSELKVHYDYKFYYMDWEDSGSIGIFRFDKENQEFQLSSGNISIKNIWWKKEFKVGEEKKEKLELEFSYKDKTYKLKLTK